MRRARAVLALLMVAMLVVLCRTALLPRLAFAQQAAADRARIARDVGAIAFDKIKHGKTHFSSGKRHLAFAPLDVDDDGDDDGDDDCLTIDADLGAAAPVQQVEGAIVLGRSKVPAPHVSAHRSLDRASHEARGPPHRSV